MKIQFDIKYRPQIESGEYKVETNDHHSVRIICWNKNTGGLDRIVALVAGGSGQEKTLHYTEEGIYVSSGGNKNKDLFIITTEPELSEFEEAVGSEIFNPPFNEEQIKVIKEESARLLELAKKEVLKGLPRWIDDGLTVGSAAIDLGGLYGFDFIRRHGKLLRISDIEKLPGFKED